MNLWLLLSKISGISVMQSLDQGCYHHANILTDQPQNLEQQTFLLKRTERQQIVTLQSNGT